MNNTIEKCEHICDCTCHINFDIHFKACCSTCHDCKEKIEIGYMQEHETQCHSHTMVDSG